VSLSEQDQWRWRLRDFSPIGLTVTVVTAVLITDVGQLPGVGFYETAAQIIPILLVR
jgi:TctA family transporter